MSYLCDVCSTQITSKANGKKYRDEDVCTCPSYWELVATNIKQGEDAYALTLKMRLEDQSGFTVCQQCATMLAEKDTQLKHLGLERLKESDITTRDQIVLIAGVVWERGMGNWPSFLDDNYKAIRDWVMELPVQQQEEKTEALIKEPW